jgi:hypothetical protein
MVADPAWAENITIGASDNMDMLQLAAVFDCQFTANLDEMSSSQRRKQLAHFKTVERPLVCSAALPRCLLFLQPSINST